jgi:hypothetical protein
MVNSHYKYTTMEDAYMSLMIPVFLLSFSGPNANFDRSVRRHYFARYPIWWSLVAVSWYGGAFVIRLRCQRNHFLKLRLELADV